MNHYANVPVLFNCGGGELEVIAEIEFTITRGRPATGLSYASGGEPAEPAEIEYTSLWVRWPVKDSPGMFNHEPAPQWLADFLTNSDDIYQMCGDAADWGENYPDPDKAHERQRDDGM